MKSKNDEIICKVKGQWDGVLEYENSKKVNFYRILKLKPISDLIKIIYFSL